MIGPIDCYLHQQQNGIVQSIYGSMMDVKEQKLVANADESGASIMIPKNYSDVNISCVLEELVEMPIVLNV